MISHREQVPGEVPKEVPKEVKDKLPLLLMKWLQSRYQIHSQQAYLHRAANMHAPSPGCLSAACKIFLSPYHHSQQEIISHDHRSDEHPPELQSPSNLACRP